jgi:FdhD protein
VIEAHLRPDVAMPDTMRHVYTSSSCGICGTDSIEAVRKTLHFDHSQDGMRAPVDLIAELPERLREAQALFDRPAASMRPAYSRWMARTRSCFA